MKKIYIISIQALTVLIIFISFLATPGIASLEDQKTIMISREIAASVEKLGQTQEVIVPSDPLEFDSMLNWEVSINKKSLTNEKAPAYFAIQDISGSKEITRKNISGTGSLVIPKGTRFKITLAAGDYTRLLNKSGAEVNVKLNYTEVMVRYAQGDKPYQFSFEILGPSVFQDWKWFWSANNTFAGNKVTHQFDSDGKTPVIVGGSGKTVSGTSSHNYYFEFEVPSLIALNPKVEPLQGPRELSISTHANAAINYGQKATYNWDFGDGSAFSSGPEADHTYIKPGRYQLVLTAKVSDTVIEKSWLVNVTPMLVSAGATVTPVSGPVPLEIAGNVNPKITGGPAQLKYQWIIAGEAVESSSIKHTFKEPGIYRVILKTEDKLHPDQVIPDDIFTINALPPQITLKPSVSLAKGYIPFTANFNPNVKVQGSPVNLVYRWEFGDGDVSVLEKPSHIFKKPGTYQVRLTVSDQLHPGNLTEEMIKMEILPPEIKLTALSDISSGILPLTVNFYAQTSVTGSPCEPLYFWNFGDGSTSIDQNPVHVFTKPGKYTVDLEVKDRLHLGNTYKTSLQIEAKLPKLVITAKVLPLTGAAPLTVICSARGQEEGMDNPNLKYVWDFGDGTTAVGPEQTHVYANRGTYSILVYVEDGNLGVTDRKLFKVTVK